MAWEDGFPNIKEITGRLQNERFNILFVSPAASWISDYLRFPFKKADHGKLVRTECSTSLAG